MTLQAVRFWAQNGKTTQPIRDDGFCHSEYLNLSNQTTFALTNFDKFFSERVSLGRIHHMGVYEGPGHTKGLV